MTSDYPDTGWVQTANSMDEIDDLFEEDGMLKGNRGESA